MCTAIFGGTFDPVHTGHIAMVRSAIDEFGLSKLVVVPNGNPPHKSMAVKSDFSHRYNMTCLAFEGQDDVEVSDYEKDPDKFSYSLDTMRYFRKKYGEDTFFIIGADSLLTIHKWYKYETLLKENRFIVFRRDGDDMLEDVINKYKESFNADIRLSKMEYVDISSTYIRDLIKKGTLPRGILPDAVLSYIKQNALYGG